MVQLLPRDRFIIQTPDALQAVLERLEANVEPQKLFRWTFDFNHAPYEGSISATGFTMRRVPFGRKNSFTPQIEGRFETPPGGTVVHITMKLHPLILIFLGCWYLIWYSVSLLIWTTGGLVGQWALLHLGLPLVILVAFWVAFWLEVERSRNDLLHIILGRQSQSRHNHRLILLIIRGALIILSFAFSVWLLTSHFSESPPNIKAPDAVQTVPQ